MSTTTPITQQAFLSDFSYILDNTSRSATFTCGGRLPISIRPSADESSNLTPRTEETVRDQRVLTKPVTLRWEPDGQGRKLTLPIRDHKGTAAFDQLVQHCMPATFGRGGEDIFCPYEAGIIDIVTQLLLPPITGGLTPSPSRSKVMQMYEVDHTQANEIEYAIETSTRKKGTKIDMRDVQQCLEALDVSLANAQEMLEISGQLDPTGSIFVERDVGFELSAKRVGEQWRSLNPNAPDPRKEWKKMLSHGMRAELYKLDMYPGASGLFKPHVDTLRNEDQIGSLVICLPV